MTQRAKYRKDDTIRAVSAGQTADGIVKYASGDTFTVYGVEDEAYTGTLDLEIVTPDSSWGTGWVSSKDFVLVPALPPAMPDLSKVKEGDTVEAIITPIDANEGPKPFEIKGEVYTDPSSDVLMVGAFRLGEENISLTAHQPAPEPEPEWKRRTVWVDQRGTWYLAGSYDGSPRLYADDGAFVRPPMDGLRPLVVIDPATAVGELVDSLSHALGERLPGETLAYINRVSGDDRKKWVRDLLAHSQPNLVRSVFQVVGIEENKW